MKAVGIAIGVVALGVVALVGVVLIILGGSNLLADFCALVNALALAIEAGESLIDAAEAFMANFEDAMIGALPEEYQDAGRVLVNAVKAVIDNPVGRFVANVIGDLVGPIIEAINQLDGACDITAFAR